MDWILETIPMALVSFVLGYLDSLHREGARPRGSAGRPVGFGERLWAFRFMLLWALILFWWLGQ